MERGEERSGLLISSTSHTVDGHRVLAIAHLVLGFWKFLKRVVGQEQAAQGSHEAGSALVSKVCSTHSANAGNCQGPDTWEEKQEVKTEPPGVEM